MFFETYASRMGFDPQVANNWYCQKDKILSTKVYHKVFLSLSTLIFTIFFSFKNTGFTSSVRIS